MDFEYREIERAENLMQAGINQLVANELREASRAFKRANILFLKEKKYEEYIKSQIQLLAIYAEMEHFDEIDKVQEELSHVVWKRKLSADYAKFHYALGFCFLRRKEYVIAQNHFDRGLAQSLQLQKKAEEENNQTDLLTAKLNICFISYAFSCLYGVRDQVEVAFQELKNMKMLLDFFNTFQANLEEEVNRNSNASTRGSNQSLIQLLKVFSDERAMLIFLHDLHKADLLRKEKKYDEAEKLYWNCYEQSQKGCKRRRYLMPLLLHSLGHNYLCKENYKQASIFLNLAKKSIEPDVFKRLYRQIERSLEQLQRHVSSSYDIVVNVESKTITEKLKGQVDFKNQFILLDMLKLFVTNQGTVYSKEELIEKIWRQKYDPTVHDNKIYVTIKRLRELVEPNYGKPRYIFRTKNGYYLNKIAKVLLK